ncbi:baseplate megatron protein TIM-barrel domain-containing protein [Methyloferula stellata]|uniref:baseplate megatron protein TIM-barrel domain-containing protein n=1 Tax=Methyloferula stellata TaxID=876270 RepID=UPI00037E2543|nr:glycoside hydrolase TIM-barrel-like domain-containing protein [Methyloferula stellata]
MSFIKGINLLPSTGEFTYDTVAYLGQRVGSAGLQPINLYASAGGGTVTDYAIALDQLQAQFPDCETVALVVAWFGNSLDVSACQIYPSTTYIGGSFQKAVGGSDLWRCSGLTQFSAGLSPIPQNGSSFVYGGTPSDQSIVRCIQDLKTRGFRVVFYPFILMTAAGFPWRGRITYTGADVSSGATAAVSAFLGSATPAQFARDATNLTVAYSGPTTDYSFRRMILHYANLCVVAGGVDLFLLGSELRGLEAIRGPGWTKAGTTGGDGKVIWDYPFVAGLMQLSDDVRTIFDSAGLVKDPTGLHNLISYSADWSDWMGFQHPGENGQWPHLDQLYAHDNIDLISIDNYLPLSDWTTGTGGLDVIHWSDPAPDAAAWPPSASTMNALGLSGQPTIYSKPYLKANIEGGEKFNWFYADSANDGLGFDPYGSDLRVSLPEGDRLAQNRQPYFANQQLLANKQLRWWWNNPHQAIYDAADGQGFAPHGPPTEWIAQSKPITFAEYGFPSCDRGPNQPNVFFDPKSSESFTPYWSIWDPQAGGGFRPRQDEEIQLLALQAIYEYWITDGHNAVSATDVKMIEPAFMSVWNWDARPFPAFPVRGDVWGDAGNWRAGQWLDGKGPYLVPPVPDAVPVTTSYSVFPALGGQGWSIHYRPGFATGVAEHVSGRQSRTAKMSTPLYEIELSFDVLREDITQDLQAIIAFFDAQQGRNGAFIFASPVASCFAAGETFLCRFENDQQDLEEFMTRLFTLQSVKLRSVKTG